VSGHAAEDRTEQEQRPRVGADGLGHAEPDDPIAMPRSIVRSVERSLARRVTDPSREADLEDGCDPDRSKAQRCGAAAEVLTLAEVLVEPLAIARRHLLEAHAELLERAEAAAVNDPDQRAQMHAALG